MEVDWGGKLRVNHICECMLFEVDWGAHEAHQNGHSITEVDWEVMIKVFTLWMDAYNLKLIGEVMIQVLTLWIDACSLKFIGELMTQVSLFTLSTLTMMETQLTSSLKDYGENYHQEHLPHSDGVPERFFRYWTN